MFLLSSCVSSRFQAQGQLTCNTTQWRKHIQQWREEQDVRFLSWKYSHYFELCQLKMRILRFVVHSVLATKYSQASKTRRQIRRNIWSRSKIKFTEQVSPDGVKQRAASKAWALTSVEGPRPPKQQKLDFGAKRVGESWRSWLGGML